MGNSRLRTSWHDTNFVKPWEYDEKDILMIFLQSVTAPKYL